MKNYKLTKEEERFHTPRLAAVKVTYESDDPNDKPINHTIIRSRPSVATIVLNENREVALIRQFRTTTGKWYWELPAGIANEGESILTTAKREVEEETGLVVKDIQLVTNCSNLLDPSKSDEDYGVAVATLDNLTARHLDEQEVIDTSIIWMNIDEVYSRLRQQMASGDPFKDGLEMSGHSMYVLLAYSFLKR